MPRKIWLISSVLLIAMVSFGCSDINSNSSISKVASDAAQTAANQALNPDEQAKLRNELNGLSSAFGVAPQATPTPIKESTPSPQGKTVGDAANKAVDAVINLTGQVAAGVQKIAPDIWRIMIRQQYAKAASYILLPWGLFVSIMLVAFFISKKWKDPGGAALKNIDDFTERGWRRAVVYVGPTVLCIIVGIWGLNRFSDSIQILINPEYYAIRDLITMLMGRGIK